MMTENQIRVIKEFKLLWVSFTDHPLPGLAFTVIDDEKEMEDDR